MPERQIGVAGTDAARVAQAMMDRPGPGSREMAPRPANGAVNSSGTSSKTGAETVKEVRSLIRGTPA